MSAVTTNKFNTNFLTTHKLFQELVSAQALKSNEKVNFTPAYRFLGELNIAVMEQMERNFEDGVEMTSQEFSIVLDFAKEIMISEFNEVQASLRM